MDPKKILLWAQIGTELVQIGRAQLAALRAAKAEGIELDDAALARLEAQYDERIARRLTNTTGE